MVNEEKSRAYLYWSFGLLALTILSFVLSGILLDAALSTLSFTLQRWLIGLTLICPASLGVVMGVLALRQPNRHFFPAILAIILNGCIALFFTALLGIAG